MEKFREVWNQEIARNDELHLSWIALLSEWNSRSSTKPWNLAQMTLEELYNKSYEGFMLSRDKENAPIGLKL